MTVLIPGHKPPQVTMQARTSSDLKYTWHQKHFQSASWDAFIGGSKNVTFSRGPARRKWTPLGLSFCMTICRKCNKKSELTRRKQITWNIKISSNISAYILGNCIFWANECLPKRQYNALRINNHNWYYWENFMKTQKGLLDDSICLTLFQWIRVWLKAKHQAKYKIMSNAHIM